MGIPIANAVTFSEAPGGTAQAFDAVSKVATAYRAGDADYAQHLAKAAKKVKSPSADAELAERDHRARSPE